MTLIECDDREAWIGLFVDEFLASARRARAAHRSALHLCLAGGSTPEPIYRALADLDDPLVPVELWLGDERAVPPGDAARNGGMIARAFAGASWGPRLHPWPSGAFDAALALGGASGGARGEVAGDGGLVAAVRRDAAVYAARLAEFLGGAPAFDLAILGLGADGHTASLFPGEAALGERSALTSLSHAPAPPVLRMTLTYPALAGARRTLFAVAGADKAAVVRALAAGDPALPASAAGGADRAIVYLQA